MTIPKKFLLGTVILVLTIQWNAVSANKHGPAGTGGGTIGRGGVGDTTDITIVKMPAKQTCARKTAVKFTETVNTVISYYKVKMLLVVGVDDRL